MDFIKRRKLISSRFGLQFVKKPFLRSHKLAKFPSANCLIFTWKHNWLYASNDMTQSLAETGTISLRCIRYFCGVSKNKLQCFARFKEKVHVHYWNVDFKVRALLAPPWTGWGDVLCLFCTSQHLYLLCCARLWSSHVKILKTVIKILIVKITSSTSSYNK